MIGAKSSITVTNVKLSDVLGELEYRKIGKPYKNEKTGETTTKMTILSDKENDMYEVTCPGIIEEGQYDKKQNIDFLGCSLTFSATGTKGFNQGEVNGILNIKIKAGEVVDLRTHAFTNEQQQKEESKKTDTKFDKK